MIGVVAIAGFNTHRHFKQNRALFLRRQKGDSILLTTSSPLQLAIARNEMQININALAALGVLLELAIHLKAARCSACKLEMLPASRQENTRPC